MRLTLKEIETRVQQVADRPAFDRSFIFDLLLAYGRSQGNITRLRSTSAGSNNVAVDPATEVAQKNRRNEGRFRRSHNEEVDGQAMSNLRLLRCSAVQ